MTREFTEAEVVALARRAYRQGVAEFQLVPDRLRPNDRQSRCHNG